MSQPIKRNWLDPDHICWVEGDNLHVDCVKLCEKFGIEPTRENQDIVEQAAIAELGDIMKIRSVNDLL